MGSPSRTTGRKARPPQRLDARALHVRILDALLRAPGAEGVKPGILRRTAQKIAAAVLASRVSSTDPIHFGALDLPVAESATQLAHRLDDAKQAAGRARVRV